MTDETRSIELTNHEAALLAYHMADKCLEPVRDQGEMGETWRGIQRKIEEAWGPFITLA